MLSLYPASWVKLKNEELSKRNQFSLLQQALLIYFNQCFKIATKTHLVGFFLITVTDNRVWVFSCNCNSVRLKPPICRSMSFRPTVKGFVSVNGLSDWTEFFFFFFSSSDQQAKVPFNFLFIFLWHSSREFYLKSCRNFCLLWSFPIFSSVCAFD